MPRSWPRRSLAVSSPSTSTPRPPNCRHRPPASPWWPSRRACRSPSTSTCRPKPLAAVFGTAPSSANGWNCSRRPRRPIALIHLSDVLRALSGVREAAWHSYRGPVSVVLHEDVAGDRKRLGDALDDAVDALGFGRSSSADSGRDGRPNGHRDRQLDGIVRGDRGRTRRLRDGPGGHRVDRSGIAVGHGNGGLCRRGREEERRGGTGSSGGESGRKLHAFNAASSPPRRHG